MRPVARLMLRSGITYRQFSEVLKLVFVQEATGTPDSRGRVTNISRVAVRTGLSRKEVARLREVLSSSGPIREGAEGGRSRSGVAARVLQVWYSDSRFADAEGRPLDLPSDGAGSTFGALVRLVGGDVPIGAVRTELVSAGAVQELPDNQLRVLKRYFVPSDVGEDLIVGIEHFVLPVLEGLAHNVIERDRPPFIQRLAYSDRLPETSIPLFRKHARDSSEHFVQLIDDWLVASELGPDQDPVSSRRVGVGVFFYEED